MPLSLSPKPITNSSFLTPFFFLLNIFGMCPLPLCMDDFRTSLLLKQITVRVSWPPVSYRALTLLPRTQKQKCDYDTFLSTFLQGVPINLKIKYRLSSSVPRAFHDLTPAYLPNSCFLHCQPSPCHWHSNTQGILCSHHTKTFTSINFLQSWDLTWALPSSFSLKLVDCFPPL